MSCFYEVCSAGGRTSATCMAGTWRVETGPCAPVSCGPVGGLTCPAGTVCLVRAGGAVFADCVPNTCGTGPVSCTCIGCSEPACYVGSSVREGVRIQCNTCPQGGCP